MRTYAIFRVDPATGMPDSIAAEYNNKGHAIARLRGLRRAAIASELTYMLAKTIDAQLGRSSGPASNVQDSGK